MFSTYYDSVSGSSYIYFGGYEQAKLTGNVSWIPIKNTGFWDLAGTDV